MIIKEVYIIDGELYKEAYDYAELSKAFTSNRHDFHEGGQKNKRQKMFEGKLGEKAVKMFLIDNKVSFIEDHSSPRERDEYDFLLINKKHRLKVDVKTRTEDFHIRTLEMVEQANSHPKDIYISVRLYRETNEVKLLGWYTYEDMMRKAKIENQGYLDNYVMYDKDLRPMHTIEKDLLNEFM
jgi:hypothetical protein